MVQKFSWCMCVFVCGALERDGVREDQVRSGMKRSLQVQGLTSRVAREHMLVY